MRGRPVRSEIRQNIIDLLVYMDKAYGYEVYKHYIALFPKCTRESVYYHLKKGVSLNEFEIAGVKQEKGDFSWGPVSVKTYYKLGSKANPRKNKKVQEHFKKTK